MRSYRREGWLTGPRTMGAELIAQHPPPRHGRQLRRRQTDYFRGDVEGLRAVAIGAVLLYHDVAPLTGGYFGVDVFFVISDFLITGPALPAAVNQVEGVQLVDSAPTMCPHAPARRYWQTC